METGVKCVLDASVVIKWFVREDDSERAMKILTEYNQGKTEIAIPELLIYEMANVLRYNPLFSYNDTLTVIRVIHNLELDIVDIPELILEEAIGFSYERKISFYDALYIAVAKQTGYEFITADEKLYDAVSDLPFARLLRNL